MTFMPVTVQFRACSPCNSFPRLNQHLINSSQDLDLPQVCNFELSGLTPGLTFSSTSKPGLWEGNEINAVLGFISAVKQRQGTGHIKILFKIFIFTKKRQKGLFSISMGSVDEFCKKCHSARSCFFSALPRF